MSRRTLIHNQWQLLALLIGFGLSLEQIKPGAAAIGRFEPVVPPAPRWGANMQMLRLQNSLYTDRMWTLNNCIAHCSSLSPPFHPLRPGAAFDYWTENSDSNIWEHCGLFEGDIMLHRELLRNGLLNERQTWPDAAVPFYIDPQDFSE